MTNSERRTERFPCMLVVVLLVLQTLTSTSSQSGPLNGEGGVEELVDCYVDNMTISHLAQFAKSGEYSYFLCSMGNVTPANPGCHHGHRWVLKNNTIIEYSTCRVLECVNVGIANETKRCLREDRCYSSGSDWEQNNCTESTCTQIAVQMEMRFVRKWCQVASHLFEDGDQYAVRMNDHCVVKRCIGNQTVIRGEGCLSKGLCFLVGSLWNNSCNTNNCTRVRVGGRTEFRIMTVTKRCRWNDRCYPLGLEGVDSGCRFYRCSVIGNTTSFEFLQEGCEWKSRCYRQGFVLQDARCGYHRCTHLGVATAFGHIRTHLGVATAFEHIRQECPDNDRICRKFNETYTFLWNGFVFTNCTCSVDGNLSVDGVYCHGMRLPFDALNWWSTLQQ